MLTSVSQDKFLHLDDSVDLLHVSCPTARGEAPGGIRRLLKGQPFVLVQRPKAGIPHPTSEVFISTAAGGFAE